VSIEDHFSWRVDRKALFTVLATAVCPSTLVALIRSFHDGNFAKVQFDSHLSEVFPIKKGVKQGCVLAPTLFSIYFSYMFSKQYMLAWMRMLVYLCFLKMLVTSSTWHDFEAEPRFKSLFFMSYYMLMMLHFVHHPLNSFKTF